MPASAHVRPGYEALGGDALRTVPDGAPAEDAYQLVSGETLAAADAMGKMIDVALAAAGDASSTWTPLGARDGVAFEYDTAAPSRNRRFRLRATLAAPPALLSGTLLDPAAICEMDPTTALLRVLAVIESTPGVSGTTLTHAIAIPGFPMRPRDFVDLGGWRRLSDGTLVHVARSVPDAKPAMRAGVLRGHVNEWGYVLAPAGSPRGTSTELTLVSQSDLGGCAPVFLINRMTASVLADYVKRLERVALNAEAAGQGAEVMARVGGA